MGKGSNVQKKNAARERHLKDAQKNQGGGGAAGKAKREGANAAKILCAICRTSFLSTQAKSQLELHRDSRHPKLTFEQCFPEYKD